MRIIPGALLFLSLALALSGCENESTAPHPDRQFSDGQRATCPESPFKPEYPIAPKRTASAQVIHFHSEIYTSRGAFITEWEGDYDPDAVSGASTRYRFVWDGRDAHGKDVPSGYYFLALTATAPGSDAPQSETSCFFWVNAADQGKLK